MAIVKHHLEWVRKNFPSQYKINRWKPLYWEVCITSNNYLAIDGYGAGDISVFRTFSLTLYSDTLTENDYDLYADKIIDWFTSRQFEVEKLYHFVYSNDLKNRSNDAISFCTLSMDFCIQKKYGNKISVEEVLQSHNFYIKEFYDWLLNIGLIDKDYYNVLLPGKYFPSRDDSYLKGIDRIREYYNEGKD